MCFFLKFLLILIIVTSIQVYELTVASLQPKWMDAFLRAATGLRSVE